MITLTANITPEILAGIHSTASAFEIQASLDGIQEMENFLAQADLKKMVLSFNGVIGDDGVAYDDISFRVTARYRIAGDLWGQGDGFRINLTQFSRDFTAAFSV